MYTTTARLLCFALMMAALALFALTWSAGAESASSRSACYPIGVTGEGFPVIACIDGSRWYQDMDGTDGAYGSEGDGRWVRMR